MLHGIISLAFGLTSVAVLCTSIKLPSYITPCSRNDPKLNECALRSARQAIPLVIKGDRKYKIPILDPLSIERIHSEQSGLKFDLDNMSFIGLSKVELLDVNLLGDVDVEGRILILPITGTGKLNVTIVDSSETFKMYMEKYKQDNGKEYWRVIGSDVPKFYVTRAYIHIDNLFNGDKVLGETTNLFLEENWKELVKDFEPLFSGALDSFLKQVLSPIFEKVPYDEIFPESV